MSRGHFGIIALPRDEDDEEAHGIAEHKTGFVTELLFTNMYTLTKGLQEPSVKWTTVITVLEFLQVGLRQWARAQLCYAMLCLDAARQQRQLVYAQQVPKRQQQECVH